MATYGIGATYGNLSSCWTIRELISAEQISSNRQSALLIVIGLWEPGVTLHRSSNVFCILAALLYNIYNKFR